jgi:hypothetical protein
MNSSLLFAVAILCSLTGAAARAQTATDLVCTSCVGGTDIAQQAVASGKIADGTIANVDIKASAITSDKIKNGTIARADLLATLLEDIDSAIADISFARISASGGGVVGAQCPSGRVAVAASCECSDSGGTRNLGVLFGCTVTGTGAAAGCFDEALSFNPQLPPPLALVRAICMGAESVDGTPWVATSAGLAADAADPEAAAARDAGIAIWMVEQHEAFETVLARFRSQRSTFESRVR